MNKSALDVLVIDDDEVTAECVRRGLRKVEGNYRIVSATDGQDGLDVLRGKTDREVRRPYVILLDLNMPVMNGFEFLELLREDSALSDSLVFILSTSDSDMDRSRAYHHHIAGYMVKSVVGEQCGKVASLLREYSTVIKLPT